MGVAHPYAVQVTRTADPSSTTTFVPLGASGTWRWGIYVMVAIVIATAAIVRQHILARATPFEPFLSESFPGITRPRDVTTLAIPVPAVVERVWVEVGDRVETDQPLLTLGDADARRTIGQMRFEFERAKNQVAQLERSIDTLDRSISRRTLAHAYASADLALAQRGADSVPNRQAKDSPERADAAFEQAIARERRLSELANNGLISLQDLEEAQIAVRLAADDLAVARRADRASAALTAAQALQARAQADLAIADQQRQRQERAGELTQARLQVSQAEAALNAAAGRLEDLTVRAPADGVVAEIMVRPGDRPLAGAPLAKIATVNPMVVDVDVPPSIVNAVRRGEAAIVRLSESGQEYSGRIRTVAPLPGEAGAHALEVEFQNPMSALLSGRTARVRLSRQH